MHAFWKILIINKLIKGFWELFKMNSIIRGNIPNLKYKVHSPYYSPIRNVTCTNEGKIINYSNINFEYINEINTKKSYLIHFRFKSTEEFITKCKRGYSNWYGNRTNITLKNRLSSYFEENKITKDKINYIEKELKLNLSFYRKKIDSDFSNNFNKADLIINWNIFKWFKRLLKINFNEIIYFYFK